jgi:small subunit ribosomal protein S3
MYKKNRQKNRRSASGLSGIVRIEIPKRIDLIQVRIYLAFPKFLKESPMAALQMNLQKEFHC